MQLVDTGSMDPPRPQETLGPPQGGPSQRNQEDTATRSAPWGGPTPALGLGCLLETPHVVESRPGSPGSCMLQACRSQGPVLKPRDLGSDLSDRPEEDKLIPGPQIADPEVSIPPDWALPTPCREWRGETTRVAHPRNGLAHASGLRVSGPFQPLSPGRNPTTSPSALPAKRPFPRYTPSKASPRPRVSPSRL